MKKSKKASKNITKSGKFTGKMKFYMQWPIWMSILLVLGCIGMFTISAGEKDSITLVNMLSGEVIFTTSHDINTATVLFIFPFAVSINPRTRSINTESTASNPPKNADTLRHILSKKCV